MAEKSTEKSAEIRIVKKKIIAGGHHGGAWKVAYADFVTAMMAFFLVMWICGMTPKVKSAVAGYFKDPVAFMEAVKAGNVPFSVGVPKGGGKTSVMNTAAAERLKIKNTMKAIEATLASTPEFKNISKYVDIKIVNDGLEVDLLDGQKGLFFDPASAKVKPLTRKLLGLMAKDLSKLPNKVIFEGHTDNRPLARKDGYTNWELSADRANSARQVMVSAGLREDQVAQVRGYAATRPRVPNDPSHFSNRRVSIIVMFSDAMQQQISGESSNSDEIKKLNDDVVKDTNSLMK